MAGKTTRRSSGDFLFANNVTFADPGTTITTTDLTTGDPRITVNNAEASVPGAGAGLEVEAGSSVVASLLYTKSGSDGTWSFVGEGSSQIDFNNATFQNFSISSINNLTVTNLTSDNVDIGGGEIDATPIGATSQSTGSFTDLTASGTVNLGTSVTANEFVGNITGNIVGDVVTGGGSVLLDISSATLNAAVTGDVTGDIRATNGQLVFNNGTDGTDATVTATLTGNVKASNNAVIVDTTSATFNGQVSSIANHTTTNLAEGTNEYFTNAKADARIAAASLTDLSDVNTGASAGQILEWTGSAWSPASATVAVNGITTATDTSTTGVSGATLHNETASSLSQTVTTTSDLQPVVINCFVRFSVQSTSGSTAFFVRLYRDKGTSTEKLLGEFTEYESTNTTVKKQAVFNVVDQPADQSPSPQERPAGSHTYAIYYDAYNSSGNYGVLTPNPSYNGGTSVETNYLTVTLPVNNSSLVTESSTSTLTNKNYSDPVLNGAVSGSAFVDDDSFGTASATTVASSESIKAYVDSQVATANELSELTDVDTTGASTNSILKYNGSTWVVGTDIDTTTEVLDDTSPQLGGDLDLNSNNITGSGDINTTGNAQFSGNLTVAGNLEIQGTTTTIDVTQLEVDDPLIYLNRNAGDNATNSYDAGVLIERGSTEDHAGMIWQESTDRFKFLTSSSVSSSTTIVSNITLKDIEAATAHVTATQAQYADLAELYVTDDDYEVGTVLIFGGKEEVTQSTTKLDHKIAGVVSTQPAYLMNKDQKGNTVAVALRGRVPVNVIGPVKKGDLIVSSDTPGVGEAHPGVTNCVYVIGRCIEDDDTENLVRLITCVV
jgi:hypothetical protein